MKKLLTTLGFALLIGGCSFFSEDETLPPDAKYAIEGKYACEVYYNYLDYVTTTFESDFLRFDTIIITALEGDSAFSMEFGNEYYHSILKDFDGTLWGEFWTGHKNVFFYPPDSLFYFDKLGLGPTSFSYYGVRIE